MILYFTGLYIQLDDPNHVWVNVEFAGALISTFSWVSECPMFVQKLLLASFRDVARDEAIDAVHRTIYIIQTSVQHILLHGYVYDHHKIAVQCNS